MKNNIANRKFFEFFPKNLAKNIDITRILRYNSYVACQYRGIAQLVEQRSPKPRAVSSSLTTPAKCDKSELHYCDR